MRSYANRWAAISMCAVLMLPALAAQSQALKRVLPLCGSDIQIGAALHPIEAVFASTDSSCKLMHIDGTLYAVMTASKLPKDSEFLRYITFDDGRVSAIERTVRIEGDASVMAFKFFHLLQDFESSGNVRCTISSFKNRGDIAVTDGTEVICGNRTLKLVSMDFNDGQRTIDVTETLRK